MAVRIKASKDIKRLTEERNAAMQEYALIMSERDSVHKEIEKLQDEVSTTNTKMKEVECSSKKNDEEKRSYICQIELLKREIEAALLDRDKAIKEAHELRETAGEREKSSLDNFSNDLELRKEFRQSKTDMEKHYKQRYEDIIHQYSSLQRVPTILLSGLTQLLSTSGMLREVIKRETSSRMTLQKWKILIRQSRRLRD